MIINNSLQPPSLNNRPLPSSEQPRSFSKVANHALENIKNRESDTKMGAYELKLRKWQYCRPENLEAVTDSKEIMGKIVDLIDTYNSKFDEMSAEEQAIIDQLRSDFSNKSLHEIFEKIETHKYLFPNVATPLFDSENSIFHIIMNSKAAEQLYNEEDHLIPQLVKKQFGQEAMNRNELLKLIVDIKENKRVEKNKNLNCYIVDINELELFIKYVIEQPRSGDQIERIQIAVSNSKHYTAVDLELSAEGNKALIMDAALDERYLDIASILKNQKFTSVFCAGGEDDDAQTIQKDADNCAFFCMDHLLQSSKRINLFSELRELPFNDSESDGVRYIEWKEFPGEYLRNVQSISIFKKDDIWAKKELRKTGTLWNYIQGNIVEREDKKQNNSIQNVITKYSKLIDQYDEKDQLEILKIATKVQINKYNEQKKLASAGMI